MAKLASLYHGSGMPVGSTFSSIVSTPNLEAQKDFAILYI